jgi:hypothetical protein
MTQHVVSGDEENKLLYSGTVLLFSLNVIITYISPVLHYRI